MLILWWWALAVAVGSVGFVVLPGVVATVLVVLLLAVALVVTVWLPRYSVPGHRPKVFDDEGNRLDAEV